MTPPIERIRYYDGEYLRAFDFAAEQGYHVDMRRRLNFGLHLYGIVEGLQLIPSNNAGINSVSIGTGMAIDPYGREIFLLAPYTFDDTADVAANRITAATRNYQVWIKYSRVAATPPSVGYGVCNANGQTTRWEETFKVVLLESSTPTVPPAVTDDISEEDPDTDTTNGVFLGIVTVTPKSPTGAFFLPPQPAHPAPVYVGLRAQRILCPVEASTFDVLAKQSARQPATSLEIHPNVFARQNLIVGQDFKVDFGASPPSPEPPDATYPSPTGNVKVAHDVFLQNELYTLRPAGSPPTPTWLSLGAYIKSFLPDIQTGTQTIVLPTPTANPGLTVTGNANTFPLPVKTSLTQFDPNRVSISASISAVVFSGSASIPSAQFQASNATIIATPNPVSPTTLNLSLSCSCGPVVNTGSNYITPFSSIVVAWVVVFYPL